MQRKFILLIVSILLFETMQAQPYTQLRFRTGFSLQEPTSAQKGYAFTAPGQGAVELMLGGEFNRPFKSKKGAWHIGFTFEETQNGPVPNVKNLRPINRAAPGPFSFSFVSGPTKTTIYGGIEKYLNRDPSKPSKNYFSVIGGLGLAFSPNGLKEWEFTTNERYDTRDGKVVEGYTSRYVRPRFPVGTYAYGGIRYNITNKKGNEVLILELRGSYEFMPFYQQTIDYTLDGEPRRDVLKHRSFGVQLGIIVPIYSFHKRRR